MAYERIRAKVANDEPATSRAKILELFDDYRRLDEEVYKRKHIPPQTAKKLRHEGKAIEYMARTAELVALRDAFVRTNSWHYMKNECYILGLW